ncbi:MAG: GGDEF domain-containing protein, partial [Candidatus Humimicrobiaceae bacterium]
DLKSVNDKSGHKIGDKLIIATADVLKNSSRKEDIVASWGGDEFIMLLPSTTEKTSMEIVKRIKGFFDDNRLDGKIPVSASIGFATKSDISQGVKDIVELADKNMYKDKIMKKDIISI